MIKEKQKKYLLDESTLKQFNNVTRTQEGELNNYWYRYNFTVIEDNKGKAIRIHHFDFFLFSKLEWDQDYVTSYINDGIYPGPNLSNPIDYFNSEEDECVIDNEYLLDYDNILAAMKEKYSDADFGHIHKIELQKEGAMTVNGENYLPIYDKQKSTKYYAKTQEGDVYNNISLSDLTGGLQFKIRTTGHISKKFNGEQPFGVFGVYPSKGTPFELTINFDEEWWAIKLDGTSCYWHNGLEVEDFYKDFTVDVQLTKDTEADPGYLDIIPNLFINGKRLSNDIKQLSEDYPIQLQIDISKGLDLAEAWIHEFNDNIYLFDLTHNDNYNENTGFQVNTVEIFYTEWGKDFPSTLQNKEKRLIIYAKNSKTLSDGVNDYVLENMNVLLK